ncbi:hypothetical protein [Oceanobacillus sojae]|uniref:Uncharacterized protein n=1 Tax=Oceanobacillus sojae TaxID=582851 RepID=A0A511ZNW8_9BACI|nr:hypothetical protein [Oceanobacillus sojae]GEN89135.1 hypothetical protein OSO01_38740 [Oceanobacillus sojae]
MCLNIPVVRQPEAFLTNVAALLDDDGKINNNETVQFLQLFVDTFVQLITTCKAN